MRFQTWSLSFIAALLLAGCETTIKESAPQKQGEATGINVPVPAPRIAAPSKKHVNSRQIGVLLPLSGSRSTVGQSLRKMAELALFDQSEQTLTLVFKDTNSTPQGAKAAFQALASQGIHQIIGPVFADEAKAIGTERRSAHQSILTLSNDRTLNKPGVYAMGLSPQDQIQAILMYAQTHDLKRVGVLIPRNSYGDLLNEALKETVKVLGRGPISLARYDANGEDLGVAMDGLSIQNLDALLVLEGEKMVIKVLKFLEGLGEARREIQVLGIGVLDGTKVPHDPKLLGVIYAGTAPSARAVLEQRFEAIYGQKPERIASVMYDAVSYLSASAGQSKTSEFPSLLPNLAFEGIDGPLTITEDGKIQRSYAILEFTRQGVTVIAHASKLL